MSLDFANAYAAIIKQEKQEDGTLLVYGKATDDSLDIDQQICDAAWLDRAMPDWFKTGGNIREQHSNIAAGVAKEYEAKADGHYITTLVVDPVSVKKVETGVLKGFSIGIKSPRVVRDTKAANGRIIDGQIVEVSLVDRPANPNAKLMLAKSINGESSLVQVEELVTMEINKEESMSMNGEAKAVPSQEEMMSRYASAKEALNEVTMMCKEYGYELPSEEKQYGESAEEESLEGPAGSGAEHELEETKELVSDDEEEKMKKSGDVHKCLECGCGVPQDSHGRTDVTTAEMYSPTETPKSADLEEAELPVEDSSISAIEDATQEDDEVVKTIIAKAVQSATAAVRDEIAILKSANEAVIEKANSLETELAKAKSLAVGSGPKRTAIKPADKGINEYALLAAQYNAKAASTTDKELAEGYKQMAKNFLAKSVSADK